MDNNQQSEIMHGTQVVTPEIMDKAQELINEMMVGNEVQASKVLDDLVRARELNIFQELGKLTREFHDALTSFRLDSRITTLAEDDIPDARERLNHVITMTNDAAERTLNAVEESLPLCEGICSRAGELQGSWDRFQNKQMGVEEFRDVSRQMSQFLGATVDQSKIIKANLNNVLMAQDFQDLTGQIIQRVIKLVDEVETNLVNLIKLSSPYVTPDKDLGADTSKAMELDGPQVPGIENADAVSGQDEVDDLLSSLGF